MEEAGRHSYFEVELNGSKFVPWLLKSASKLDALQTLARDTEAIGGNCLRRGMATVKRRERRAPLGGK